MIPARQLGPHLTITGDCAGFHVLCAIFFNMRCRVTARRGRKIALISIKVALSAVALFVILRRLSVSDILSRIPEAHPAYVAAALLAALITVPLVGARWRLIAGTLGFPISQADATRATFAGLFVGQILPGAIGGDVIRGWLVWGPGTLARPLVTSLILDRLSALVAVFLLIVASLPGLFPYFPDEIYPLLWAGGGGTILLAACSTLLWRRFGPRIRALLGPIAAVPVCVVVAALAYSVAVHGLTILSAYFLAQSLGVEARLTWMLIMPIVILAISVPISINGWGIREGLMAYMGARVGLSEPDAVMISLCMGFVAILASIPGLWFWLAKNNVDRTTLED
jgi:uncharacterized membrane protein YbhN (UPF0104 family)